MHEYQSDVENRRDNESMMRYLCKCMMSKSPFLSCCAFSCLQRVRQSSCQLLSSPLELFRLLEPYRRSKASSQQLWEAFLMILKFESRFERCGMVLEDDIAI